ASRTTSGSTWPSSGASWRTIPPARATCSPSLAWATVSPPREEPMTAGMLLWSLTLCVGTALAEILGCYLTYAWLRQGRSAWLLVPAAGSLGLFACVLSGHRGPRGGTYAAYGAVYVSTAVVWLGLAEQQAPDAADLIGAAVSLAGMAIIVLGHARGG